MSPHFPVTSEVRIRCLATRTTHNSFYTALVFGYRSCKIPGDLRCRHCVTHSARRKAMSTAPGNQAGFSETQHNGHTSCYYKCISCGQRFWQKKAMIRRAAKCKGTRVNQHGVSQKCKAWRCRYNDQCPGADAACAICGAFKPPEFMPTRPATASNPAFVSRPASSANPSSGYANLSPANHSSGACISPLYGHPESGSQWMTHVGNVSRIPGRNPSTPFVDDCVISEQQDSLQRQGNITLLPLYGDVVERYLTEV